MYEPKRLYKLNNETYHVVHRWLYGWLSNHTCLILDGTDLKINYCRKPLLLKDLGLCLFGQRCKSLLQKDLRR